MQNEPTSDKSPDSSLIQNKLVKKMDHRDLIRSSFWVGQIFMLVATVMGVFLAAQSGLEQALTFDSINRMESNYYLRKSLQDELTDNAQQIYDYTELLKSNPGQALIEYNQPKLDSFVWNTMKSANNTLGTPSYFLTESRRFYRQTDVIVNKITHRHISLSYGRDELLKLVTKMQKEVIPKLDKNCEKLKISLEANGIDVDAIKGLE